MISLLLSTLITASSPQAAFSRVKATYSKGDLCASFVQTYEEKLRRRKKVESGRLWAKRDGRVRWTYEKPIHKDFVYDGKKAFFYEPENAQVTEFDKFENSPLWGAIRFLWGQGDIINTFTVTKCTKDCPKPANANIELWRLTPKTPIAAVAHIILEIDTKRGYVNRSIVYDPLGNQSEYTFSNIAIGCKVDEAKFIFNRPEGVNVVYASSEAQP
ncbi:MAG: outer membrane lipoprotein carrier protein LolA [Deltaproteobacteria bacterium]|nr:outer membrane lipoprotein carrier protein LolA [Deltaproteobacteria bacterium]